MAKSSKQSVEKVLSRAKSAFQARNNWQSLYQEIDDYAKPERQLWTKYAEGARKNNRVFDSTAVNSTVAFANRIQSDMFPPFQKWVTLKPGPFVPEGQKDAIEEKLDEASNKIFAVLTASNFDTVINECLLELASGTMIMLVEEGDEDEPLTFSPIPCAQVGIEEGKRGRVTGVFREYEIEYRNISETWKDAKLTEQMQRKAEKEPTAKVRLVECCYKLPGQKKYCYEVIAEADKDRLVEREYDYNPFLVARWSKIAGEAFGRGPLVSALPDIKTLNKLVEYILRFAALRIAGVWSVTNDGVVNPNNLRIIPGATIPVARNGGPSGPSLANIAPQGDIQLAELEREKLAMNIKGMMLDNKLPPDAGPVRSATEIMQRIKELVKDVGAPFGRLMTEFVVPLVQNVLIILHKRGLIKDKINVNGLFVRAQVVSPLAMVQNISDVENVVRWLQISASFGDQTLQLGAKLEDIPDWIGEKMGIPTELRRDKEERKTLMKAAAETAKAQAIQQNTAAGAASAAGNTIPVA